MKYYYLSFRLSRPWLPTSRWCYKDCHCASVESRPVDAPLASPLKPISLGWAFHTEQRLSITSEREEVGEINVLHDWEVKRATVTADSGGGLLTMHHRRISFQVFFDCLSVLVGWGATRREGQFHFRPTKLFLCFSSHFNQ